MTLIYIPFPLPNESAASLLLRASYNNGYRSLSSFLNAYGFPVYATTLNSMLVDQEKFKKIIHKLGIVESSIEMIPTKYGPTQASPRIWYGKPISYQFFCADGIKLCPECVKESGILKKDWLLKHLTCCTYHRIKLISQCSYCHHPISSNRKRISECYKCHKVFCSLSFEKPIDEEILANIWFLENLISNDVIFIKSIKIFLSAIHSTIDTFKNMVIDYSLITLTYLFFKKKSELENIFLKIININKKLGHPRILLIHLLTSMNYDIQKFALDFLKRNNLDNLKFEEISKDFILTKRATAILIGANRAKLNEDHFLFLKNKKGFSAKKVNSFLLGTLTPPKNYDAQYINHLTLKEVSVFLGINYDLTTKLFSTDTIIKKEIFYKDNHPYHGINKHVLIEFDQQFITINRLAKDLHVLPQYLPEKLGHIGILPVHGPSIDNVRVYVFNRKEVEHLTQELVHSIDYHERRFGHKGYIYKRNIEELKNTALKLKISMSEVKKLFKHNILISYKHSPYQSFYISENSINYVDNIINSGDYVDIREVYLLLNCSVNWLKRYWIDTGFLEVLDLKINKYVQKVNLTKIQELRKHYFTGVEASNYLGMSHQHITNLQTQGLIQAFYLGSKNKIRLFLKKDVYAIKIQQGFLSSE